jgi:hypothetical protein
MKTTNYFLALILLSFVTWSCTSSDDLSQGSLKTSINKNVQELTTAMNAISSSSSFKVLTNSGIEAGPSNVKSSSDVTVTPIDSIMLSDITGVYDYNRSHSTYKKWQLSMLNFFTKSADNATQMIVKLPEEKVLKPRTLLLFSPADTLLTNNYVFTLNDYVYKFNRYLWDYKMASIINIKGVDAGALKIQSGFNKDDGYHFASEFAFPSGAVAKCDYANGDTAAVATYSISDGTKTLYEEKYTSIKNKLLKKHRENSYSLTVGDIQIVRNLGKNSLDSAKVFVAGVLQVNSKVEVVDVATVISDTIEVCITNQKRELKITFDDGTSSTMTQLLGSTMLDIRKLFISLRQTYFATSVVDWIAWDIYRSKK